MNKYEKRLVGCFALLLAVVACGSGTPDPTDQDYADLAARSASLPAYNCYLVWDEDDKDYDVQCSLKGVDIPDGAVTGHSKPKSKQVKPKAPAPQQAKPVAPKPAAPKQQAPAPRPAPRTR